MLRGYGDALPFGRATFASAVSNSVLEHIPDVDIVLCEVARVLRQVRRSSFVCRTTVLLPHFRWRIFLNAWVGTGLPKSIGAFSIVYHGIIIAMTSRVGKSGSRMPALF